MYAVGRLGSYIFRGVDTVSGPFHPFGGAVDIIVVEQPDGSFKSSPWYVRFGKFQGVLKTREKVVNISVNGVEANFHMYLDHKGRAYFLKEADGEEGESVLYPSSSGDETDGQSDNKRRPMKSESCNFDADKSISAERVDLSNGKIVARTTSRRSRILGLVFGRRSTKDESYREGDGGAGVVRVNSLERAEIAADLLEMKWSTNLASNRSRRDNASRFSPSDMLDNKGTQDMQITDEEGQVGSSFHDNMENSVGHCVFDEETDYFHNEKTGNSTHFGFGNLACSVEEVEMSCLSTGEQVETSAFGGTILEEKCEVISEISRKIDEFSIGNSDHDENMKAVISEFTGCGSQIPDELEACPSEHFDEQVCDERNVVLPRCDISKEESGSDRVQSFIYCETSESSIVGLDGSGEQTHETLYLASGECGEVHVHAKTLHAKTELLSEGTIVKLAQDVELGAEQTNPSPSCMHGNEVDLEEPFTVLESYTQMVSVDPMLTSAEGRESQSICTTSSFSDSSHQVKDEKYIKDDLHLSSESIGDSQEFYGDLVPTKEISIPASESSEEEQFPFSDLDESKLGEAQCTESMSPDCINKNNTHSFFTKGNKEVKGSVNTLNTNDELSLSPDKFVQENPSTDHENSIEKLMVMSSPIGIPRSHRIAGEEVSRLVESLPSMWSSSDRLDAHDLHHLLSHSLDSNSKTLKWTLLSKDDSSYTKLHVDKEHELAQKQPNTEDTQISGELKKFIANPGVEISLCKHLLYEGMGADAASQAFDAEKLDVAKFISLGPEVMKNENLVVKIGGHYFPWDAAASIVLGMVSFGSEKIFEAKGMIAVDRVEKSLGGDPSKAIIPSGGSWRLWPFSFQRSRSRKAMQPALSDAKRADAENASESTNGMDGDKNLLKPKVVKKMTRGNTPTSEQLASLNLKEGRNTVTFTFSTAMLGNQQVDARIYLWKWNTRVVISDVDGTITKSDVLGQFMPMVGIDWCQTGVAHLFSAIKENGYQLLFLSARAISQAYHTRQFLVNLKQDGKALPDGPVVISPDGLFPSLFREVIRRAPHEFKIACLEDIKALFPSDSNPFHAGFGNRDTDEISYLKVGIPKGKIFIINPKGEVAVNHRVDTKSYTSLHDLVHGMFPPMTSSEPEDFNSWNYWKLPPLITDL